MRGMRWNGMVKGVDRKLTPFAVGHGSDVQRGRWPIWDVATAAIDMATCQTGRRALTKSALITHPADGGRTSLVAGSEMSVFWSSARCCRGVAEEWRLKWVTVALFTPVLANVELTGSRVQD